MNIRAATHQDSHNVQSVHLCAFPEGESEMVSKLAMDLLFEKVEPPVISLVAEIEGAIVGHIAFSPAAVDNNDVFQGYILAPLGVKPKYQKCRIGSKLILYGIQQLSVMEVNRIFVYGDPEYYGRFGFRADAAHSYIAPYELQYPSGWQAIALQECDIEKSPAALQCVDSLCAPTLW